MNKTNKSKTKSSKKQDNKERRFRYVQKYNGETPNCICLVEDNTALSSPYWDSKKILYYITMPNDIFKKERYDIISAYLSHALLSALNADLKKGLNPNSVKIAIGFDEKSALSCV